MWNYVFGRMFYNLLKGIVKCFQYFFIAITSIMFYSVYFATLCLWWLIKISYWCAKWSFVEIKKTCKFIYIKLIELKKEKK